jgi:hypothetical protein
MTVRVAIAVGGRQDEVPEAWDPAGQTVIVTGASSGIEAGDGTAAASGGSARSAVQNGQLGPVELDHSAGAGLLGGALHADECIDDAPI